MCWRDCRCLGGERACSTGSAPLAQAVWRVSVVKCKRGRERGSKSATVRPGLPITICKLLLPTACLFAWGRWQGRKQHRAALSKQHGEQRGAKQPRHEVKWSRVALPDSIRRVQAAVNVRDKSGWVSGKGGGG